jgi:hypothetical protein
MSRSVMDRVVSLAGVLRRDPLEFADRVGAIVAGRVEGWRARPPAYEPLDWEQLVEQLPVRLRGAVGSALAEPALVAHERRLAAVGPAPSGIDARHDGDVLLARCCYAMARALRPGTVVETGVAHGMTSSYILAALRENGSGVLHSIDLPPHDRGAEAGVGRLVPTEMHSHWRLHRGLARRVLPGLLAELGTIGMFVHDSLHTLGNMRLEFGEAWPRLQDGGAVIADDVEGNVAFHELRERTPLFWAVCRQAAKPALFGVALR